MWVRELIDWYNNQHCHCRIRFVTSAQRHQSKGEAALKKCHALYEQAKQKSGINLTNDATTTLKNAAYVHEVKKSL